MVFFFLENKTKQRQKLPTNQILKMSPCGQAAAGDNLDLVKWGETEVQHTMLDHADVIKACH